jgi:hydroxypyruvate isomerase
MEMTDAFLPGLMMAESHFAYYGQKGVIADAVSRIAAEGFFKNVEIADIPDKNDRKQIANSVHEGQLRVTQWMTMILVNEGLNLSSTNETLRRKSAARIKEQLGPAVECGASYISVLSGPDPGSAMRKQATEQLYTSLCELCQTAGSYSVGVLIEPLDREAHKKGFIGPTDEAANLIERVKHAFTNIGVCWDSSHAALNGEDIFDSIAKIKPHIVQMHLANPVLDKGRSDFGDYHIPIGEPGYLTIDRIAEIYKRAIDIGLFIKSKPPVAIEVRTPKGGDPWQTIASVTGTLRDSWRLYQGKYQ